MNTTPEQLITFQAHTAKLIQRITELNIKTPHSIEFNLRKSETGHREHVQLGIRWFVNGDFFDAPQTPNSDSTFAHSWMAIEQLNKWFLDANIALDLLEAELKAA
ncbi:hypothetical protein DDM70_16325 [Vibrio cholerae]|uniref:hypothetical protein n=1 Tax=Vibrio metoecus TaxID=1481663 RepID=UPI00215B9A69|nr:hypothetical protein [Vibrio metoecus]EGR0568019.1 hypothetical protein [Vibrio cholerae]EGR4373937.1 hypothetical protein [Vibrio cholerae]ELJ8581529.1 hypothetical protein [Vibrio cholerae]ELJ8586156.1 hypothetical protein [Vibrio cholerae]ELJ8661903.1 hypothetical protein [Vibrio cholerae]